ncbi:hypothetical protein [Anaerosporobacter sp.]
MNIKDNLTTLSRSDYFILATLYSAKAFNGLTGMTQDEIRNNGVVLKRTAMYKHIKLLVKHNYMSECGKNGHEKVYCITKQGRLFFEEDVE